ncbi:MAG: acylphosphatase [Patescibacteria group bacterium]
MTRHLTIRVYGIVQGVFFRDSAKQEADNLSLSGFVRNEPDGSVYIEIEGEDKNLEKFLGWCRKGSLPAKTEKVDVGFSDKLKEYKSFRIDF